MCTALLIASAGKRRGTRIVYPASGDPHATPTSNASVAMALISPWLVWDYLLIIL